MLAEQTHIEIHPRDIDFDLDVSKIATWSGGDKVATAYFNALSILFPEGERFFIESVAAYAKKIEDPKLKAEVKAFTKQEALHTREHLAYNAVIGTTVDVAALESAVAKHLDFVRSMLPPLGRLAVTCALEHFTAIMAHEALQEPLHLANAEPGYGNLWTWHAVEECEHKSVAYDVFQQVTGGKKYWLRVNIMALATVTFVKFTSKHIYAIFKAQGMHRSLKSWVKLAWYLVGRPGMVRHIIVPYLRYYAPDFHPSHIDDRRAVSRARTAIEAYA